MIKKIAILLSVLLIVSMLITACGDAVEESGLSDVSQEESVVLIPDENAQTIWNDIYSDGSKVTAPSNVYNVTAYSNGTETEDYASLPSGDTRYLLEGESATRAVVLSEGYALTLHGTGVTADFSLGALRSKYYTNDYVLTVSYENQNPYGANEHGFNIYYTEWLARWIDNIDFLQANGIRRSRAAGVTTDLLPGYTVNYFDMTVTLASKMSYDNYSIAVVRPTDSYEYFYLFVMKSKEKTGEWMDEVVSSFTELEKGSAPVNSVGSYELIVPDCWNDETLAYYNKLMNQTTVDFGAFYEKNSPAYVNWLAAEEQLGTQLDIFMTYLHIGWYNDLNYVDLDFLNSQAGGNGFNGKPVLEFTYQFTTDNNALAGYTPMYDICKGKYDDHFRKLAQDLKAYGKPVLFRVNNEMNTDWTSYCGMVTMLDPDIFIETWQRMYNIFLEEGVDNCIWIWNPIATSCPYSNWGDMLNYFPGPEYVQMLGLTYYQMNNSDYFASFREMYTELYNKNTPYFDNYPAILGEFGCAAGGDYVYDWSEGAYVEVQNLDQRRQQQADWIKGMFDCFMNNQTPGYEFCKNIKAAAWFSANDYATVNGQSVIINHLKLDEYTPLAIAALREGLERMKEKQ